MGVVAILIVIFFKKKGYIGAHDREAHRLDVELEKKAKRRPPKKREP
jgi:hypothetical protein